MIMYHVKLKSGDYNNVIHIIVLSSLQHNNIKSVSVRGT